MCVFPSEKDRVVQVNAISMDGVVHSFAVQTLRKCGKVAKIVSITLYFFLSKHTLCVCVCGFEGCINLKEVKVFLDLAKDREGVYRFCYLRYRLTELCTE